MNKLLRTFALALALLPLGLFAAGSIDINTADASALEQVKGVGPARAGAIVKFRSENGPFKSVDDLVKVPGIGEKSLEQLRGQVTVSAAAAAKKK